MSSQSRYVVGNWKMNLSPADSAGLVSSICRDLPVHTGVHSWVAPTTLSLMSAIDAASESELKVGAQNAYFEDSGAFTGEVSISMLREVGAHFTIIGHSERRSLFGESNELCVIRAKGILSEVFPCIFCIGESLSEREAGKTHAVIDQQLQPLIDQLSKDSATSLIIAYEPVWAIGTGKVASTKEIEDAHGHIADLWKQSGPDGVNQPPLLYGGSVKPDNFAEILQVPNVDGALVGGASLKAESFLSLVEIARSA